MPLLIQNQVLDAPAKSAQQTVTMKESLSPYKTKARVAGAGKQDQGRLVTIYEPLDSLQHIANASGLPIIHSVSFPLDDQVDVLANKSWLMLIVH